jgi:hypothetical protein
MIVLGSATIDPILLRDRIPMTAAFLCISYVLRFIEESEQETKPFPGEKFFEVSMMCSG